MYITRAFRPDFLARRCCPDTPVFFFFNDRLPSHDVTAVVSSIPGNRRKTGRARTKTVEKSRPGHEEIFRNAQYTCVYIITNSIRSRSERGRREKIILQQSGGGGRGMRCVVRGENETTTRRLGKTGVRQTDHVERIADTSAREHLISNRSRNVFIQKRDIARNKFPRITRLLNISSRTLE